MPGCLLTRSCEGKLESVAEIQLGVGSGLLVLCLPFLKIPLKIVEEK